MALAGRVLRGLSLAAVALLFLLFLSPPPAQGSLKAGQTLAQAGQYRQALAAYSQAAQLEPWRPRAWLGGAALRWRLGEISAAEQSYRTALSVHPADCAARLGLGRVLAARGEQTASLAALWPTLAVCPDPEVAYRAGMAALAAGDFPAAREGLQLAGALADAAGQGALARQARLNLALLLAPEQPDAALAELAKAQDGAAPGVLRQQVTAREAVLAARQAGSSGQRDAVLGRGALAVGLVGLAEGYLRRSLAADPGLAMAQNYLPLALLAAGKGEEAESAAQQALRAHPDSELARYALAASERVQGRPGEAILDLKALLATAPTEPTYLLELGAACADYGDYESAVTFIAQAAEQPGATPDVLLGAARFHLDRAYQPERALTWAEKADAELRDGESGTAYGWALHLVGRDEDAMGVLTRAVAQSPLSAEASYYLGVVCERRGLTVQAVAAYGRAADLDPLSSSGQRAGRALLALAARRP